jgi:surface polysaccharide O-acyltransferase-like enzyme
VIFRDSETGDPGWKVFGYLLAAVLILGLAAAFWFVGAVLQGPRASTTEDFAFLYGYVVILALLVSFVVLSDWTCDLYTCKGGARLNRQ